MNYGQVKSAFLAILNRRDVTPTQLDTFAAMAIQRIDRELRVPAMEKQSLITVGSIPGVQVPGDLLEVINISIQNQQSLCNQRLTRTDLDTILGYTNVPGTPTYFYRQGGVFLLGPNPPYATQLYINYYASTPSFTSDTSENWVSDVSPDLIIYGMLSFAADLFVDDRAGAFEGRYGSIRDGLMQMAGDDELKNASVRPFAWIDDSYDGDF